MFGETLTRLVVTAFAAACIIFASVHAHGAEGSRLIDFTAVLSNPDGEAFQDCADETAQSAESCKKLRPLTLGIATFRALTLPEQGLNETESWKRGHLGYSLYREKGASVTAEDIALIKKQMAKRYSPAITAVAFPLLDPAQK
jgi:hypothetical protein